MVYGWEVGNFMSQVDKLNYLPLLFWFILAFSFFYILIFSFFLPLVFGGLKVRGFFFHLLLIDLISLSVLDFFLMLNFVSGFSFFFIDLVFFFFKSVFLVNFFNFYFKSSNFFCYILEDDIIYFEEVEVLMLPEE